MSRVLFAWELGAHLGHLARDLPLACRCRDEGLDVVFAVPDLRTTVGQAGEERLSLVQAPLLRPAIQRTTSPVSYADLLLHQGYDDRDALRGALRGWLDLIDLVQPSVLVFNHAPTALLAARLAGVPVLLCGTGFEIAPQQSPLPSLRPWQPLPARVLEQAEAQALSSINAAVMHDGPARLERLADLFTAETIHITGFAELDPFGPRAEVEYVGPVHMLPRAPKAQWTGGRPRIFAYLRPGVAGCENLLQALQDSGADVICALPGCPPAWASRFDRLQVLPHAVELSELLLDADAVVTYGPGTLASALLAGVPVLFVPQMLEQHLSGLRLHALGAGILLDGARTPQRCAEALQRLLQQPGYRHEARSFARQHSGFDPDRAMQKRWNALAALVKRGYGSARLLQTPPTGGDTP